MAQWVKDLALSLLWLWLQPWLRFNSWPRELAHAVGSEKKKKKKGNCLLYFLSLENTFPMKCYDDHSEFLSRPSVVIGGDKEIRDHQPALESRA